MSQAICNDDRAGQKQSDHAGLPGMRRALAIVLALTAGLAGYPAVATAAQPTTAPARVFTTGGLIAAGVGGDGTVALATGKTLVLATEDPCKRVSIGQPDVADVNLVDPSHILLTAKRAGTTQLIVWDDADRSQVVDVNILADLQALERLLATMFPAAKIQIANANGTLALYGRVRNLQEADQAVQLATAYAAGGKVLNLLEVSGGQQVMLEVRIAEVSREATNALGANFGFTDGPSYFGNNTGQVSPLGVQPSSTNGNVAALTVPSPSATVSLFGRGEVGRTAFAYYLEALRQNNLMRTLAEPNLIAISGQEASFLAGGEFPIPVPQSGSGSSSTVTITYKEYGVRLVFVPVVLGEGRIRLKVEPEVSDLDFSNSVSVGGYPVPALITRRVSTTIELAEGQSFAIAGLLNQTSNATRQETPLLADVPILGALFRSVNYQRNETELLVLVTPRLVEGLNPAQVPLLPGETWRHPTEAELFWNRDLGGEGAAKKATATTQPGNSPPPRFCGDYGFVPAAARPDGK